MNLVILKDRIIGTPCISIMQRISDLSSNIDDFWYKEENMLLKTSSYNLNIFNDIYELYRITSGNDYEKASFIANLQIKINQFAEIS